VEFPQRRLFSSSGYIYLLWVFGSALLLLFIAIVFMRNQVRPIRKLAAAAERFGRGRDVQFFKPQGAREVRQAGESFMSMHRRIRRQIEQRTLMLAGVSHDLRTPLTRLKLEVSMMPDTLDKANILNDLNDMERMISGYLGFIRGEGDETEVRVNLGVFLADIVNDQQRDGFQINTDIDADFNIDIRVVAMERCLNNILSNARQYGTRALVRAFRDGDRAHIIIEDDGPGIPPEEYDEVFKPFYRSDKARANPDGHVGLGLSIAMDVVHMHGGRIWLDRSNDLGGLAVNIRLPI